VNHLTKVHPKAQADDRRLQQTLRKLPALSMKRMVHSQPKHQTKRKSERRSDQTTGSYDNSNKKQVLHHRFLIIGAHITPVETDF
jgi:hypothetical protein